MAMLINQIIWCIDSFLIEAGPIAWDQDKQKWLEGDRTEALSVYISQHRKQPVKQYSCDMPRGCKPVFGTHTHEVRYATPSLIINTQTRPKTLRTTFYGTSCVARHCAKQIKCITHLIFMRKFCTQETDRAERDFITCPRSQSQQWLGWDLKLISGFKREKSIPICCCYIHQDARCFSSRENMEPILVKLRTPSMQLFHSILQHPVTHLLYVKSSRNVDYIDA